ncbi:hypothetical protein EON66_06865 [archaeon]|nr:MAG: hypothetical protein EON66_06865 [archaeon]
MRVCAAGRAVRTHRTLCTRQSVDTWQRRAAGSFRPLRQSATISASLHCLATIRACVYDLQAKPKENDILQFHYVLEGPPGTPFAGGYYHGILRFPPQYPLKPPSVMMYTPSGRFSPGSRICLSMSDFHPEVCDPVRRTAATRPATQPAATRAHRWCRMNVTNVLTSDGADLEPRVGREQYFVGSAVLHARRLAGRGHGGGHRCCTSDHGRTIACVQCGAQQRVLLPVPGAGRVT